VIEADARELRRRDGQQREINARDAEPEAEPADHGAGGDDGLSPISSSITHADGIDQDFLGCEGLRRIFTLGVAHDRRSIGVRTSRQVSQAINVAQRRISTIRARVVGTGYTPAEFVQ
jgi:hypothetical protein